MPDDLIRPSRFAVGSVDAVWVKDDIARWIGEEPVTQVLEAFGGRLPDGGVAERLAYLDAFSAEHWDFRQGRERSYIENVTFEPAVEKVVFDSAARLGLTGTTVPQRSDYDHVLILGGLARACLSRPRYAAGLIGQGLTSRTVVGLTAFRPLGANESDVLDQATPAIEADNEMEVMAEGLRRAFDLPAESTVEGSAGDEGFRTWTVRTWETPGPRVSLVVAPSPAQDRRANSADTYVFWADKVQHLSAGQHVLLVTSSIYTPFQGADAVRVLGLPRGVLVETVGLDATEPLFGAAQQFSAAKYLQEIRSTVRSAKALHEAAEAAALA